jgi:hypothetical protein
VVGADAHRTAQLLALEHLQYSGAAQEEIQGKSADNRIDITSGCSNTAEPSSLHLSTCSVAAAAAAAAAEEG